jgi:putative FmdB family regulatory protein
MPFYEYQCARCGHHLEAMQKITASPLKKCPDCGKSTLKRLMSAPVFRLKGAGWYETDFKGGDDNKRNLADRPDGEKPKDDKDAKDTKDDKKDVAATDAKPGDKPADKAADKAGDKVADKAADKPAAKPTESGGSKPSGEGAANKPSASRSASKGKSSKPAKKPARHVKRRR